MQRIINVLHFVNREVIVICIEEDDGEINREVDASSRWDEPDVEVQ